MSKKEIIGVIFPILPRHVAPLFEERKDVFVKFTKFMRLETGSKIVFQVSGEKMLVGEGVITNVEKLDPEIAWVRYGERIFLGKEEYDNYVKRSPISDEKRKMVEVTAFTISDLKRYKEPIKSVYNNVTPAGRYLTRESYYRIKP